MSTSLATPPKKEQGAKSAALQNGSRVPIARLHFVWILASLILIDAFMSCVKPLQYLQIPGVIFRDGDFQMNKLDLALAKGHPTDVLLLGSSTLLASCQQADFGDRIYLMSPETCQTYTGASSFQARLKQMTNESLRCMNVGVSGAMLADDQAILEQYLKNNSAPRAVMLFLSSRDIADCNLPAPDQSRVVQHINDSSLPSSQQGLMAAADDEIQKIWRLYSIRGDYQQLLEFISCAVLQREPTLYAAAHKMPAQAKRTADIKLNLPPGFLFFHSPQQSAQNQGRARAQEAALQGTRFEE